MATDGEDAGTVFEFSYGLTDEEIKLFSRITDQRRAKLAPYGSYYYWMLAAGAALAYSGGAIAHSYYGVPLDSRATALVMALFAAFVAGAVAYRWLITVWLKRISAWKIERHKKIACSLRVNQGGIALASPGTTWHATWGAIEDITLASGMVVFWYGADTGLAMPLRAIPAAEERVAFIDALKAWSKAR
jgi:membrane-associated protease RseP (regulator of RpoE activity)